MKEYQIIFLETVISCVDWYPETMLSYGVGLKEEKKKEKKGKCGVGGSQVTQNVLILLKNSVSTKDNSRKDSNN